MSYHKSLFVFDIETIPDLESARNLLGDEIAEADLAIALRKYHLEITNGKNDFIRQLFHKVIVISFLEAEIHQDEEGGEYYVLKDIRSGGKPNSPEKDLIQGFFQKLNEIRPRLVSFNGKTFDLPVLKYRAMKYGVQAKWLHKSGDKWNNYNSKYSFDWHCDLLEAFSDFGQSAKIKMNEICALFDLPGKINIDGSMVEELFHAKKVEEIRDYCELDVVNTYLLYLRYMHHTGTLSQSSYENCISDLISFIENKTEEKQNFDNYLKHWRKK